MLPANERRGPGTKAKRGPGKGIPEPLRPERDEELESVDPAYFFDHYPEVKSQVFHVSRMWMPGQERAGCDDESWLNYDEELPGIKATRPADEVFPPYLEEPDPWC